jgi:hypothetical protein
VGWRTVVQKYWHESTELAPARRVGSFPANNSGAQKAHNWKIKNEAWKLMREVLFIRYIPISQLRLEYIEWCRSQQRTSFIHTLPLCVN